jgi:hypothetical protein
MSWADLLTHSIAFLSGALTGAAGKYLADKYTDQRHRQEEQAAVDRRWAKIQAAMPALIQEMKGDLTRQPLVREFVVLPNERISFGVGQSQPRFRYFEDEHPNLRGQLAILEAAGYIRDVTPVNAPIYRMSEDFVDQVTRNRG